MERQYGLDSSVIGRNCHGCGCDEIATTFLDLTNPPTLRGFSFCTTCGYVYSRKHQLGLEATKQFNALGRPGFDGRGKLWEPGEYFEEKEFDNHPANDRDTGPQWDPESIPKEDKWWEPI